MDRVDDALDELETIQRTSDGVVKADTTRSANCVETTRPQQWGPIYRFLGKPAMRTGRIAGAADHKSA